MQRGVAGALLLAVATAALESFECNGTAVDYVCTEDCFLSAAAAACVGSTLTCAADSTCWGLCGANDCDGITLTAPASAAVYFTCGSFHSCPLPVAYECTGPGCTHPLASNQFPRPNCAVDGLTLPDGAAIDLSASPGCVAGAYLNETGYCVVRSGGRVCETAYCTGEGGWAESWVECPACLWEGAGTLPSGAAQCEDGRVCAGSCCGAAGPVRCGAGEVLCADRQCRASCANAGANAGTRPCDTDAPATDAPPTDAPQTAVPVTDAPQTGSPATDAPTTNAPQTAALRTSGPQSHAPGPTTTHTAAAATGAPTTAAPAAAAAAGMAAGMAVVRKSAHAASFSAHPGAGKLALLAGLDCKVEDVDLRAAEPLDWAFHPLGLPVGGHRHRYFLGAVVCNSAIILAALLCQLAFAACAPRGRVSEALAAVRFPTLAFVPLLFLYQGITLSAANLAFGPERDGSPAAAAAGWAALAASLAVPGLLYARVVRGAAFEATTVPDPKLAPEADPLRERRGPAAPGTARSGAFAATTVVPDPDPKLAPEAGVESQSFGRRDTSLDAAFPLLERRDTSLEVAFPGQPGGSPPLGRRDTSLEVAFPGQPAPFGRRDTSLEVAFPGQSVPFGRLDTDLEVTFPGQPGGSPLLGRRDTSLEVAFPGQPAPFGRRDTSLEVGQPGGSPPREAAKRSGAWARSRGWLGEEPAASSSSSDSCSGGAAAGVGRPSVCRRGSLRGRAAGAVKVRMPEAAPPLAGWKRSFHAFFFGARVWVNRGGGRGGLFVERYGVCFEQYREGCQRFAVLELASILGLSAFATWRPATAGRCNLRNSLIVVLLFGYQAAVFWAKPYLAPFDNILAFAMTTTMTAAVLLMTIALALEGHPASTVEALYSVSTTLLVTAAFALLVKAVYDVLFIISDIYTQRRRVARKAERTASLCRGGGEEGDEEEREDDDEAGGYSDIVVHSPCDEDSPAFTRVRIFGGDFLREAPQEEPLLLSGSAAQTPLGGDAKAADFGRFPSFSRLASLRVAPNASQPCTPLADGTTPSPCCFEDRPFASASSSRSLMDRTVFTPPTRTSPKHTHTYRRGSTSHHPLVRPMPSASPSPPAVPRNDAGLPRVRSGRKSLLLPPAGRDSPGGAAGGGFRAMSRVASCSSLSNTVKEEHEASVRKRKSPLLPFTKQTDSPRNAGFSAFDQDASSSSFSNTVKEEHEGSGRKRKSPLLPFTKQTDSPGNVGFLAFDQDAGSSSFSNTVKEEYEGSGRKRKSPLLPFTNQTDSPGNAGFPAFDQEPSSSPLSNSIKEEYEASVRRRKSPLPPSARRADSPGGPPVRLERGIPEGPLKEAADLIRDRLGWEPDQLLANWYRRGVGINPHKDQRELGPRVATVSLLSDTVMEWERGSRRVRTPLPVGTLCHMEGEARSLWTHGIRPDDVARDRVSLTYRAVREAASQLQPRATY
ncbi:hypothetical protein DIPPA_14024 [Diplonema papillatum]|nr:hypothetical protein DIPPA_14024 [Diplonema papillatum]